MALSRPRTTRVLRGSALGLGLGLIIVADATASPALAMGDGTAQSGPRSAATADGSAAAPLNATPAPRAVTGTITPEFGRGKELNVQVQPTGPVPDDLDLSGAVFRATQVGVAEGVTPATDDCVTDQLGACMFDTDDVTLRPLAARAQRQDGVLPVGQYTLVQVESSPGLDVIGGSATLELCTFFSSNRSGFGSAPVDKASLFRTEVTPVVTDSVTGAPLAGAAYELTGPDYPHRDPVVTTPDPSTDPEETVPDESSESEEPTSAEASTEPMTPAPETSAPEATTPAPTTTAPAPTIEVPTTSEAPDTEVAPNPFAGPGSILRAYGDTVSVGVETSDAAGSLTFDSWFLPENGYTLTPVTGVDGYRADTVYAFGIQTTSAQAAAGEAFPVSRPLVPAAAAPTTTPAPTTSSAPVVPTATPRPGSSALATTGSPVETMTLLGLGMLALGGAATATGTVLRRRARQLS